MDRLLGNAAAPVRTRVVDPKTGMLTKEWRDYFERMPDTLEAIPSVLNKVSLSTQTASLSATNFSDGVLATGLYRLTYGTRIVSPAGGGSLNVTFRWTDGGVACSYEGIRLILGVDTTGTMSESPVVRIDRGSAITYETDWSGGQSYNLDVTLEKVREL